MKLVKILTFALSIFLLLGCNGLEGSCEQFNIDSYELATGMNIPKVLDVDCFSNDSLRISIFHIDTEASRFVERYTNMQGYIDNYSMAPVASTADLRLKGFTLLPEASALAAGDLYMTEGINRSGRYWKFVVNKANNVLVSEMALR